MRTFGKRLATTTAITAVLLAPAAPAAATAPETTTLSGTLIQVLEHGVDVAEGHADGHGTGHDEHGEKRYAIQTDDGRIHPIDPAAQAPKFEDATSGDHVVARVEQTIADEAPAEVVAATVTATTAPNTSLAPLNAYVVTINDTAVAGSVSTTTARTRTQESLTWWAQQGRGATSAANVAAVQSWTLTNSCNTSYWDLWEAAAQRFPNAQFFGNKGDHLVIYSPEGCTANLAYNGIATVGANLATGGYLQIIGDLPGTVIHELGHNFSLGHSNLEYTAPDGKLRIREYLGLYGPQSATVGRTMPSALDVAYQSRFNLPGTAAAVRTAPSNAITEATLSPVHATSGTRAVKFNDTAGRTIWIEYRSGTGVDAGTTYTTNSRWSGADLTAQYSAGVRVYRSDATHDLTTLTRLVSGVSYTTLSAGQTFTAADKSFSVAVTSTTTTAANVKVTVGTPPPAQTPTTLTVQSQTVQYGRAAVATAKLTGASNINGPVQVFSGDAKILDAVAANGTATLNLPSTLNVGTHQFTARYLGTTAFAPSEGTFTVSVQQATSTIAGTAVRTSTNVAATTSVTVTTSTGVRATGTVELYDGTRRLNAASLNNGAATLTVPAANATTSRSLTVKYLGTHNITASQSTVTLTVSPATASIDVNVRDTGYGKQTVARITVTAPGNTPAGTVAVRNGSTVLASGALRYGYAALPLPTDIPAGTHQLTVTYSGDTSIAGTSTTARLWINMAAPVITVNPRPTTLGTPAVVDIHVGPRTPTAVAVIYNGTTKLTEGFVRDGQATLTIPASSLTAGNHNLTVRYRGDNNLVASSKAFTLQVAPAATRITVANIAATYGQGATVPVTIHTPGANGGRVEIIQGATRFAQATVTSATAGITAVTLPGTIRPGTHTLTVRYLGAAAAQPATTTFIIRVAKTNTTLGAVTTTTTKAGTVATVDVELVAPNASPTGTVRLKVGNTYVSGMPVELRLSAGKRIARVTTTALPAGRLSVEYSGDAFVNAATLPTNITIS